VRHLPQRAAARTVTPGGPPGGQQADLTERARPSRQLNARSPSGSSPGAPDIAEMRAFRPRIAMRRLEYHPQLRRPPVQPFTTIACTCRLRPAEYRLLATYDCAHINHVCLRADSLRNDSTTSTVSVFHRCRSLVEGQAWSVVCGVCARFILRSRGLGCPVSDRCPRLGARSPGGYGMAGLASVTDAVGSVLAGGRGRLPR